MPLQLPPLPDFNVKTPDITGEMLRAATLSQMLNENKLRQQLAPLQVQEQQQKAQQAGIQTQQMLLEQQSNAAMVKAWSDPDFTKKITGDGTNAESSGLGFDPNVMMKELISRGVSPNAAMAQTQDFIKRSQMIADTQKAIAQTGEANAAQRTKGMKILADKIGSILDLPMSKAGDALTALKQDIRTNTQAYAGVPQDDLLHIVMADLQHLPAMANLIGLESQIADFHKSKAEAVNATPEGAAAKAAAEAKAKLGVESSPEALALAGAKAGAEAKAKFPYELALKQEEVGQNPAFAFNPQTGQRELTTVGEAKQKRQQFAKVTQADIEKETSLNSQMNDMQLNTSRYRAALNAMGTLTTSDSMNMSRILSDAKIGGYMTGELTLGALMDQISSGEKAKAWNALSPDKQDALIGYLRMKNTGLLAQKVLTGMGRASKEALDIELSNMPAPMEGATVGNKKLDAWQDNLDQINSRSVKLPWMETPKDVRTRIEGQATATYNAAQAAKEAAGGQYKTGPGRNVSAGQWVTVTLPGNRQAMRKVSKVYRNGTFDVEEQ